MSRIHAPTKNATDNPVEDDDFDDLCEVCGGEGWMMACDGDGGDWGEDIYTGPMDATMTCRHCNGTGFRK